MRYDCDTDTADDGTPPEATAADLEAYAEWAAQERLADAPARLEADREAAAGASDIDDSLSRETAMKEWGFPELAEEDNEIIREARACGFASFFPSLPNSSAQAANTLKAAKEWLKTHHIPVGPDDSGDGPDPHARPEEDRP